MLIGPKRKSFNAFIVTFVSHPYATFPVDGIQKVLSSSDLENVCFPCEKDPHSYGQERYLTFEISQYAAVKVKLSQRVFSSLTVDSHLL